MPFSGDLTERNRQLLLEQQNSSAIKIQVCFKPFTIVLRGWRIASSARCPFEFDLPWTIRDKSKLVCVRGVGLGDVR